MSEHTVVTNADAVLRTRIGIMTYLAPRESLLTKGVHVLRKDPDIVMVFAVFSLLVKPNFWRRMHQVLGQLLEMEEKREQLNATLVSALTYLAFLLVFSIAVVIFVLVVVFPKFSDISVRIEDQLPLTTQWLMSASHLTLFRSLVEQVEQRVQKGNGIAYGFKHSEVVPDIAKQMITAG